MSKDSKTCVICLLATIAAMLVLLCNATPAAVKTTYTFTSFTYSRFGDADRIDMIETLKRFAADASKKVGVTFKYVDYGAGDYSKAFKNKTIDFGLVSMEDVFQLKREGVELEPLALVSMKKRLGMRGCIYVKNPAADLKSLTGATVNLYGAGTYVGGYILIRKLMFDNGVDMPPYDFFGPIFKIPYEGSGFQSLLLGKVDAVADADWNYEVFGKNLPGAKSLKTLVCTEEYPVIGIFMQKGLDKTVTDKLKAYLKTFNSNPNIGELRTIFLALDIRFVDPDPKLMQRIYALFDEGAKRGWMDEAEAFSKKMDKLEFGKALAPAKKDYKQCKALCDKNADKAGCIDKCMGE